MLKDSPAFSGFSVDNLKEAENFYGRVLGIEVENGPMGLELKLAKRNPIFIYEKVDHQPATYTVLNFPVDDLDKTIDEMIAKGIKFEHYDLGNGAVTDEKGVLRGKQVNMGPDIAWFKDPAGNVLSVLSN